MNVMEMEQQNCSSSGLKQRQHISRPPGPKKPQSRPQVVRQKARDPANLLKTICSRVNLVKKWNLRPHEICILLFVGVFAYYSYFHFDNLHFHVVRTYAWAGYDHAQHRVGQHYMLGKGVEKHPEKAMEYYKLAAEQGHAEASHNLAIGHIMKHIKLEPGEARRLLVHASANGVENSDKVISKYCEARLLCDD